MAHILILNGPNLNLLGQRDPKIYGKETLADIQSLCTKRASAFKSTIDFRQSNHEGELIGWIQEALHGFDGLIINAGAYTHTSVAIYDALTILTIPVVEVHLSNLFKREPFRHHSYITPAARGMICGFGAKGYEFAVEALVA